MADEFGTKMRSIARLRIIVVNVVAYKMLSVSLYQLTKLCVESHVMGIIAGSQFLHLLSKIRMAP